MGQLLQLHGGIGAVIGYALGTAFPLFIMISLGSKVRNQYPDGKTLTEVVRLKFGNKIFKNPNLKFNSVKINDIFLNNNCPVHINKTKSSKNIK